MAELVDLRVRLDPTLHREIKLRAVGSGKSLQTYIVEVITRELLGGGLASRVRLALEGAKLVEVEAGRAAELELAIGEALGNTEGESTRARVVAIAEVLHASTAVAEIFGTEPELRRQIRETLAAAN